VASAALGPGSECALIGGLIWAVGGLIGAWMSWVDSGYGVIFNREWWPGIWWISGQ